MGPVGPRPQRTYYGTFAGDSSDAPSTSTVVTISVSARAGVTLTASNANPAVNQKVTLTARLDWWNPTTRQWVAASGEPIQIWRTLTRSRWDEKTGTRDARTIVTFATQWASGGTRLYYATFAGDTWYQPSASYSALPIIVH
jgi:hypothetical protein